MIHALLLIIVQTWLIPTGTCVVFKFICQIIITALLISIWIIPQMSNKYLRATENSSSQNLNS